MIVDVLNIEAVCSMCTLILNGLVVWQDGKVTLKIYKQLMDELCNIHALRARRTNREEVRVSIKKASYCICNGRFFPYSEAHIHI